MRDWGIERCPFTTWKYGLDTSIFSCQCTFSSFRHPRTIPDENPELGLDHYRFEDPTSFLWLDSPTGYYALGLCTVLDSKAGNGSQWVVRILSC